MADRKHQPNDQAVLRIGFARAARIVTAVAVAIAISVGAASAAAALTDDYHPAPVSRDFASSVGGWTASTTQSALLCLDGVTCPVVTNAHVATGGAGGAGDGFIRTASGATIASLLNTTTATWTSPTFVYDGAGGQTPDSAFFTLDRRVDAGALLALLSGAHYRVKLDNLDAATTLTLVNRTITNQPTWKSIAAVDVDPGDLTIGDEYRFRIVTELDAGVAVLTAGTFDYDNVLLRATKADTVPTDSDGDTVADSSDNCVSVPNTDQADADEDGIGDVCDMTPGGPDTDGDGVLDATDNCVQTPNLEQTDTDGDGTGDACDTTPNGPDTDNDGIPDPADNCDASVNPGQSDKDGDGIGDACDTTANGPDTDNDGVPNATDNCDNTANPGQSDKDGDGIGDACDTTPNGPASGTCQGTAALVQDGLATGDTLRGTDGRDLLRGQKGNDRLLGRGADDCLKGGQGNDTLRGHGGRDVLSGNAGRDVLTGQADNDRLRGQKGNDRLKGGRDNDKLTGGLGRDRLNGGSGIDVLLGGMDVDRLTGGKGKDTLNSGRGDDRIFAVDGKTDVVRCGGGVDKVVVDAKDKVAISCERVVVRS